MLKRLGLHSLFKHLCSRHRMIIPGTSILKNQNWTLLQPIWTDYFYKQHSLKSKLKYNISTNYKNGQYHNYCSQPYFEDKDESKVSPQYEFNNEVYTEELSQLKSAYASVVKYLTDHFNMTNAQALTVVDSDRLHCIPNSVIIETLIILHKNRITGDQLLQFPHALEEDAKVLEKRSKLLLLPHLFNSVTEGFPFCLTEARTLQELNKIFKNESSALQPNYKNRLYFIAHNLDMSVSDVTSFTFRHSWKILTLPLDLIEKNCRLIKESDDHETNFLRLLHMPHKKLVKLMKKKKLKQSSNESKTNTYNTETISKYYEINKRKFEKRIAFLIKELNCTEDELIFLSTSSKFSILSKSCRDLKECIQLLHKYGFSDKEIRENLIVFHLKPVALEDNLLDIKLQSSVTSLTKFILDKMKI